MTNKEAVNWIINLSADIGKSEHSELWHYEQALYEIREMLESAQSEIIRCEDCKWWGYDDDDEVVRVCHAAKHGHMSRNWSIMIYRTHKGDFYCADAERKNDE